MNFVEEEVYCFTNTREINALFNACNSSNAYFITLFIYISFNDIFCLVWVDSNASEGRWSCCFCECYGSIQ